MRERELKLVVPESYEVPDLTDLIAGTAPTDWARRENVDVYFDTHDLRLARWGCTLRHREGEGWTVKIPTPSTGAMLDRQEVEFEGPVSNVPADARALAKPFTRGADVEVVAFISTQRDARVWRGSDGAVEAELCDDSVEAVTPTGGRARFREIEVELGPEGDERSLDAVLERLTAAGAGPGDPTPKLVRVLGEPARSAPDVCVPVLGSDPTAAMVIQAALAASVSRLLTHLPSAWLGTDPRGVHQSRVATRRIRSDLKTFEPLLDAPWSNALRGELRWLADELGAVRDADVLGAKLRAKIHKHPEIAAKPSEIVLGFLEAQRSRDRAVLLAHLADDRAVLLFDHLVDAAAAAVTKTKAERRAREVMSPLVHARWNRLRKAVEALGAQPGPAELHAVRILAKRVRYATEAVLPATTHAEPVRFARAAADVQDALGDLNDAAVACRWLTEAAEVLPGPAAFAAGQLSQQFSIDAATSPNGWRVAYDEMTAAAGWLA